MSKLSFGSHVTAKPFLRPMFNLGCLLDLQSGHYVKGVHGESIMNGGLSALTGVCGLPNTYKSTIAHYMLLQVMNRYTQSHGMVYDTEMSVSENRFQSFSKRLDNIDPATLVWDAENNPEGRLLLTDAAVKVGDKWFDEVKAYATEKVKAGKTKEVLGTTPFKSKSGELFQSMYPSIIEIDSLSRMPISTVDEMMDKNSVGASGNNTEAMKGSSAKSQMLIQLPVLTAEAALSMIITAHVSDKITMDPYAPDVKKLAFLKNGLKLKYVPDQYNFLMNNMWFCFSATKLVNQSTKCAEFPRDSNDTDKYSTDLMTITLMNLRGKYGASGLPYEFIVSQSEGLLVGLTEFNYLKQYGGFGLGGHDRAYYLELLPSVTLSRTTIRSKLDQSAPLRRAMEITSELLQMHNLYHDLPEGLLCSAKELYEDIKAKGYDWDILLNTRGYWIFEGTPHPQPFLSTMDLLRIRSGEYVPYWYADVVKKKTT